MSRYTVNGAPWAIGKDVSDCKSSAEVMHKAGLDFIVENVTLWLVCHLVLNVTML